MKLAVLFFAFALTFSASAFRIGQFFGGLAQGLNYKDLTPEYDACNENGRTFIGAVLNLTEVVRTEFTPLALAEAVEAIGHGLGETVRACGKTVEVTEGLIHNIIEQANELNKTVLSHNVIGYLPLIFNRLNTAVADVKKGDALNAGKSTANIVALILYGRQNIPAYAIRRQLFGVSNDVVGDILDVITDIFHILEIYEGFLHTANTTLNATDVLKLITDTTVFGKSIVDLLHAVRDKDAFAIQGRFNDVLRNAVQIYESHEVVRKEIIAGLQRDLPLFGNKQRLENGVNALFTHFDQIKQLADQVRTDSESGDFLQVGAAIGQIYNIFYGGLIQ